VTSPRSRPTSSAVRRSLTVVTVAGALVAVPAAAFADTPQAWPDSPHVSGLEFLMVLLLFPLGMALAIAVLVALPSLVRGTDGKRIPGLFAAGRAAAGVSSHSYVSGLSVADAIFSGRNAGRGAAATAKATRH